MRHTIQNPEIKNGQTPCPNCSNPIETNRGKKCPNCGTVIIGVYRRRRQQTSPVGKITCRSSSCLKAHRQG